MDDKNFLNLDDGSKLRPKPLGLLHTFYISGVIEDSKEYNEWFDIIRHANDNDMIKFHINSPGGDLFTAIQFMRVMTESNATLIASVEGACMSAATMIFLCADQFEISEHSMFMFHNYSGIAIGKGGEMYDNIVHERKWSEKILRRTYENFLTEDEIKSILDNKDIWMEGDEVIKRLEMKHRILTEKVKVKPNARKTTKPTRTRKPASTK
jgi:ATP-dependent protease ClpP protease subunit